MNSPRVGLRVAAVIFGIVSLAHLGRVILHLEVHLGGLAVPEWASVVAVIGAGAIAFWMWRLAARA